MKNKNILISGASIAGPALAYWLKRFGFNPTIVEWAPKLREGGYKIDVRGAAIDVIRRMGIYDEVRSLSTEMIGASFVNAKGERIAGMPASLIGLREKEDVEIMRGDLSRIIYDKTCNDCEYLFNDSITAIRQTETGVEVEFKRNAARVFDLVIAADGIHSNVRSLVFGDEAQFIRSFGDYYFGIFSMPNYLHLDRQEIFHSRANKVVNVYSTKHSKDAKSLFIFRSSAFRYDRRDSIGQKEQIAELYADMKWEVPTLLQSLATAPDFYFDTVNQIKMDKWFAGRTALLGDAAYAPSLASGQGTSMALVGAYVLAGELLTAQGDHQRAFPEYQKEMADYVQLNQKLGENVHQMVPGHRFTLWLQLVMLRMMKYLPMNGLIIKKIKEQVIKASNKIILKDY
jgi:2-polyprenyl-6-methoxyphenol hydroxylase-like FAD-dependent oxidoreductase